MLSTTTAALVVASILFVVVLLKRVFVTRRPPCTVPAGPRGHWLLGHAAMPVGAMCKAIFEWRATHGPIVEFCVLPRYPLFVVVSDAKLAKEMLMSKDFASRETTNNAALKLLNPNLVGIISQSWSPTFKELHKFTLTTLSGMGFGRVRMEQGVVAEADALVDVALGTRGRAFDPEAFVRIAVSNVITDVVFGVRTEIDRPSPLHENLRVWGEGFVYLIVHPVYNLLPSLMKVFRTKMVKDAVKAGEFLERYIAESLEQHRATLNPEDPRDLIDAIVLERGKRPDAEHLSDENVSQTIFDLFLGGTDTTSFSLLWMIGWLLHRPDVRLKLLAEIRETIGMEAAPSIVALNRFHYLQAFLDEVLRRGSVLPFSLHHRPTVPVAKLGGYDIPDHTTVLANIWGIHHDPELWEAPMEFRPERFLDAEGKYRKNENLMPFSVGTRRCIGEKLARLELFVFTVRLLQRVEFRLAEGCPLPPMEGRQPATRAPESFQVTAIPTEGKMFE